MGCYSLFLQILDSGSMDENELKVYLDRQSKPGVRHRHLRWRHHFIGSCTTVQPTNCSVRDNDNLKSHKYVCITTYQPDTKSNPNPNPNPNPTTKQHAIVNIELNIITCSTYPDKFIRYNVVAPSVPTSVVIVALPQLLLLLQMDNRNWSILRHHLSVPLNRFDLVLSTITITSASARRRSARNFKTLH